MAIELGERELKRRNSIVRVVRGTNGLFVEKTYHARYTARQEYDAYLAIDALLGASGRVRRPLILGIEESRNTIRLEYVNAPNLRESCRRSGVAVLDEQCEVLITLFAKARSMGIRFDSDPTNLLVACSGAQLVIVDPVAIDLDLPDFSAVVFLVGLLKGFLGWGTWYAAGPYWTRWKRYYRAYLRAVGIPSEELNAQLVRYIDVVVGWNLKESGAESLGKRVLRSLLLVPMWRLMQVPFRRNLVKA